MGEDLHVGTETPDGVDMIEEFVMLGCLLSFLGTRGRGEHWVVFVSPVK